MKKTLAMTLLLLGGTALAGNIEVNDVPLVFSPTTITETGTGVALSISQGLITQTLSSSLPASSSGISQSIAKDYTLAQSTSGTNGNGYFINSTGDYFWGVHVNLADGATGGMAYVAGLHNDETFGVFIAADVATPHPVKIYHRNSTMSTPMIEGEAETDWYSDYTAGLSPTFGGTFNGEFLKYNKRNVTLFEVDNDGSVYSYADATDYARFYMIDNTAGTLKSNITIARWAENGSYLDFSSALGGNLLMVVGEDDSVTVTPSGGRYALVGAMRLTPQASPPASAVSGDIYMDSTASPDELCVYDGAAWQGVSSGTDANCA